MGSGGLIVMDEDTCMVDVARYFVDFLSDESCGKCLPCREGLQQMKGILEDITQGGGKKGDIELLEALATVMIDTSLCALGTTAANPVVSTIRNFRGEYEAHVNEKRCPAGACKQLTTYYIDPAKCAACMICLRNCPVEAITGARNQIHVIEQSKCTKCGTCYNVCPSRFNAVKRISGEPIPQPISMKQRAIAGRKK
jgi:NADH-quinone oxidoreductase subunit F